MDILYLLMIFICYLSDLALLTSFYIDWFLHFFFRTEILDIGFSKELLLHAHYFEIKYCIVSQLMKWDNGTPDDNLYHVV